jgi:hypothetical protein
MSTSSKGALEGDLKSAVLNALKPLEAMGRCKVLRHNAGRRGGITLGAKGTPDIQVLVRGGKSVWLEVKRPGNWKRSTNPKTVAAQAKWREDAAKLEHSVHIVQSVQDAIAVVLGGAS